jgi:hypothetical protein
LSKPPFTRILVADAETRWSSKPTEWCPEAYTLKKLTTEEYIRNPLFKAFGFCFKWYGEEGAAIWIPHWKLKEYLDSVDWSTTAICCHNAQFDAAILAWHYGVIPAFIFDTLSMARALRGLEVGNSAFKLAQDFGLPPKGNELVSTDGLFDLPLEVEAALANYCRHDVWLCEQFLVRMLPGYPAKELRLIDMTIRMFTEPQLELDSELLRDAITEGDVLRGGLLNRLCVSEEQLASNDRFAEVLRAVGVEPPIKTSKTTGEPAFAFAKNDALFVELCNSDNEEVALLCEARMRVKSTQERTRAQRFLDIASRGKLPVPVNYAHTRTLRWGAAKGSNINMQNLKRGGKLRKSIVAPPGHTTVAGDLSQIEPRVLAYLSDYQELLDIFASGKDAYAQFGATMFGVPGLNKEDHPDLRQSAKSALLGAGYQLGWASFAAQLLTGFLGAPPVRYDRAFAKRLGIGRDEALRFVDGKAGAERLLRMSEIPHTCTDEELLVHCICAKEIIDRYRRASQPVVDFWAFLERMIATVLAVPDAAPVVHKCLTFKPGEIILPNGLPIKYDKIKVEMDEKNRPRYSYWNGKTYKNLYAGVVAENVTSGTARCVIADGMLRVQHKYRCAMPVHDEGVWVVPEGDVADAKAFIKRAMTLPVPYLPGIPLDATVGSARRYGEAK